ncbi:MAG: hypothetical protein C9356_00050 [Oleiphilus sp.]|nr:MAG: hypothetical protein C9356_00050 [Oleiphilus sp.]
MMSLHQFIDLTPSSPDEQGFPTEIAWSLSSGEIKSVLVLPDEDWEPWENCDFDTDVQHLMDQGVTAADIVRELNDDLNGQTVYVDGLDDDPGLLEKLFEACGEDLAFELATLSQLYPDLESESLYTLRMEIAEENNLEIRHSEGAIHSLLLLNARLSNEEL